MIWQPFLSHYGRTSTATRACNLTFLGPEATIHPDRRSTTLSVSASGGGAFDNGLGNGRGNDPAQLPAPGREQLAKLFFGALASAREDQHLEVQEFARSEIVAG